MSRILLASGSTDLAARIRTVAGDALLVLPLAPLPGEPALLFAPAGDGAVPDVVVLDCGSGDTSGALALAARLDAEYPAASVLLVSDEPARVGYDAMRAGVRDILATDAGSEAIHRALDRALRAVPHQEGGPRTDEPESGRVIGVVSPKGGTGKTMLATNLAVGLARREAHSTVLVDLDVQFGDVASALDLEPEYTLPDAVRGPAAHDTMVLKTFLTRHETGLYVLCGPRTPADADSVTTDDVRRLLQMLASEFRNVVVDTAPGLPEHTLTVMDHCTDLLLLTSMDVPGVRGLRKELDVLSQLDILPAARRVVVNFADPRGGLTRADVEATIGTRVDLMLPRSKGATASVNQGVPLLQSGLRDPLAKQLQRLVDQLAPDSAPAVRTAALPSAPARHGLPGLRSKTRKPRLERNSTAGGTVRAPAVRGTAPQERAGGRHRANRGGAK